MKTNKRRITSLLLAAALILTVSPQTGFAASSAAQDEPPAGFADMPSGTDGEIMQRAVDNGILTGYDTPSGQMIRPGGTISRAELATIINRAFGAKAEGSLTGVLDVKKGSWYEKEMARAVKMETMKASAHMRPNDTVTREEAFVILYRAFMLTHTEHGYGGLDTYKDKAAISSWAEEGICTLTDQGYISGVSLKINPKEKMTRLQLAEAMDRLVTKYYRTPRTYTDKVIPGNVMINSGSVSLQNMVIKGNLIIGDGVANQDTILSTVTVEGKTLVRPGVKPPVKI